MKARILFALIVAASSAYGQAPPAKGLGGEWRLAFTSESNSGEPQMQKAPWITFVATVVQVDSALGGAMRSDGLTGQFGCKLRDGACTAGRMRLSWDDQDWQVFEFRLDPGSVTEGSGRAEIRFPDGAVHKYTFVITRLAAHASDPDFGPNVTIFDPSIASASIQAKLDSVFSAQESSEFGDARVALLFKPGTYDVDARIGFYTQLSGLGLSPDDVTIRGGVRADARWMKGNATLNFWRIAENLSVNPAGSFDRWAVSQAAPMRRMHIRGDLVLDDGGWSSGGFLADSKIDGQVKSGSQQQWLTRNSELGSWNGSNWNMVFVGTPNAPAQSFPTPPYTTVSFAPVIREKPFLYVDALGAWKVFVPALRSNASGTTWSASKAAGVTHPISDFFIAKPGSPVSAMNDALARGKQLIITPGIYHLDTPLHATRANTIILGLGLATLVADHGTSAITLDDVGGVIVAGVLVEAGATNSPILVQVGPPGSSASHSINPSLLSDVFVRVGGAGVGKATQSVQINSSNVIGDHLWLWRADHGSGIGWTSNTAANGLVVNGSDVTMYGLFVEHYQAHQVSWNGNGGRTFFFQNEMPYDVPQQSDWMSGATRGFAAYQVASSVTSHQAWGLGSYCFFNKNPAVVADRAFEAPSVPGVRFHDMVTVSLGGKGTIMHVINGVGPAATAGAPVQKLRDSKASP